MNKPLNFNADYMDNPEGLIDDLTYGSMVYNVENCGLGWEDIATLFGQDSAAAAQARYEQMKMED
jgi:hypothetical protein